MRWQYAISYLLNILTGLLLIALALQLVTIPFKLKGSDSRADLSDLSSFRMTKLQSLQKYQEMLAQHALFSKPVKKEIQKGPSLDELLRPYELTGIIQGAVPEALIQNRTTRQTSFIKAGQQFDRFQVLQIKSHSIIVEHQGEQKEMHISEV